VSEKLGGEPERVVVRDRRRIDPRTGEARVPGGDTSSPGTGLRPSAAAAEPDAASAASAVSGDEVAGLAAELAERTADLQRVSAEYANYRRRVERDREAVVTSARAHVVSELLAVLDDLERAEAHGDLVGAFKVVADKLVGALQKLGVEPFGADGDAFDPTVHEAVHHDISPDVEGPTVTAVLRRGYRLNDRMLRPAMVAVTDRAPAVTAPAGGEPGAPDQPEEPLLPPPADPFNPRSNDSRPNDF
jgi:molecular chaperone GrpE